MKHIPGDRRNPTEEQQLVGLASQLSDQAALNEFVLSFPAEQRNRVYALIAPHVPFEAAGKVTVH